MAATHRPAARSGTERLHRPHLHQRLCTGPLLGPRAVLRRIKRGKQHPEGLTGYEQDGYILWFPARYSVDGTEIYETDPADGEEYRVAGIRPTEAVADPTIPFSDWDTRYTDAVQVTDLELNTLSARCYHLQEVDEESVVGGYRNTLVYCICLGDRMAVIELTPLMGRGGISSTRDPFEEALFYTTTAI